MDSLIIQIQQGEMPKNSIIENLKLQVYAKYATEVISNRCSAKEAASRTGSEQNHKKFTPSIINSFRKDINFPSPFRKLTAPKQNTSKTIKKIHEINNRNNDKNVKKNNNKLCKTIRNGDVEPSTYTSEEIRENAINLQNKTNSNYGARTGG